MITHIHYWYDHVLDFRVEMMNEENTRVYPEFIRVSLRLVGQLSYEWIWGIISVRGKW